MPTIYIDGSFAASAVGYGVRIEHGNGLEHFGGLLVRPTEDSNLHEYFAFIEGALFAFKHGFKPSECHFVTDYDRIVYGNQESLANGHGSNRQRDSFLNQIIRVRKYYSSAEFNLALTYTKARFSWVRGHGSCVGNHRVDHLASKGRARVKDLKERNPVPYDDWLAIGLLMWNKQQNKKTHQRLPFTDLAPVYALCV